MWYYPNQLPPCLIQCCQLLSFLHFISPFCASAGWCCLSVPTDRPALSRWCIALLGRSSMWRLWKWECNNHRMIVRLISFILSLVSPAKMVENKDVVDRTDCHQDGMRRRAEHNPSGSFTMFVCISLWVCDFIWKAADISVNSTALVCFIIVFCFFCLFYSSLL